MTPNEQANRATIKRWYEEMWGKADSSKVADCIATTYLRHDVTGANNPVTVETYSVMVNAAVAQMPIRDFTYFSVVEGDFIGTLGRFLFGDNAQWDWVQLFRANDAKLAETWLPGMGGTEPRGYPSPENAWTDGTIPDHALLPMSTEKDVVRTWYECLAGGADGRVCLADHVRGHDILDSDITLDAAAYQDRWRALMKHDQAYDLELFLIQEGAMVFAVGMWRLGANRREWNWVQAFRFEAGQIAQSWLSSIGGTDRSLRHGSHTMWDDTVLPTGSIRFGTEI